ncbi:nucleotidyltransferase family protein [Granulicella arctica]|uniref:Putative nucleotidyltransferase n=1 Tax=Granulicella arctica TaxID=940613 RepID=A0A7Y9PJ75_9BACT|nr:nucleotidyltransferase domain-containing protein [Granulicella arctica]NYF80121.1 putative nucleotidyltransferase [Granulicella arctica]
MSQMVSPLPERVHGLYLAPSEWEIVGKILRKHVLGRRVWAFGSRATGMRLKRYSDLDLAVEGSLTLKEESGLADDFDESALPMKVDVVGLEQVEVGFRERIVGDFVVVQAGGVGLKGG